MRLVACLLALAANASAINIDPAGYTGRYILSGPGVPATSFVGPQILPLADGSYAIDTGANVCCALNASSSFEVTVSGNLIVAVTNQVTSAASGAAVGSGSTLTFNTVAVDFDPGVYSGRYFLTSHDRQELQGAQSLQLIPDLEYSLDDGSFITVSGVASDFLFALDAAGDITVGVTGDTGAAAVASGTTLGFNSVTLSVDPGSYAGSYASSADAVDPLTGQQAIAFIGGLTAYLIVAGDAEYFVPGSASLAFSGGETFSLSVASQATSTPSGANVQVPLSSVTLNFSSVTSSGTTSVVESGAGQPFSKTRTLAAPLSATW
jgi:hypothetical protein